LHYHLKQLVINGKAAPLPAQDRQRSGRGWPKKGLKRGFSAKILCKIIFDLFFLLDFVAVRAVTGCR
jgi:hypothetical protein